MPGFSIWIFNFKNYIEIAINSNVKPLNFVGEPRLPIEPPVTAS